MVILNMTRYNMSIRVELHITVIVATCWKEVIPECAKEMVNGLEPHQYASVRLSICKVFDHNWILNDQFCIMLHSVVIHMLYYIHVHRVK